MLIKVCFPSTQELGNYSMLIKVCFPSTQELDFFINQLQTYGKTETQIVFSTPVEPRGIDISKLEQKDSAADSTEE